jgi:hypothetical protein
MKIVVEFLIFHGYFIFLTFIAIVLFCCGICAHKTTVKQVSFNVAAIFFALALYETYLWINAPPAKEKGYNTGTYSDKEYFSKSDFLGYEPVENGIFTSKKHTSDSLLVYDVTYTIKHGIRYTPNSNPSSIKTAVFLGCSVTFGEGVNDTSTLPYYFNEYARGEYDVYNYGFHGYGTHHMLAIVESKLEVDLPKSNTGNTVVFYSFIPDHIRRSAGYSKWDQNGPHYEIKEGKLVRQGNFSRSSSLLLNSKLLTKIWQSSYTYSVNFALESRKATHNDVLRTVEIIKKANGILQRKGIKFYIIAWNYRKEVERIDEKELNYFYSALKDAQIPVLFVSAVVSPDEYARHKNKYSISNDGHPTPFFYKTVAEYIGNQIKN